MLSMTQKVTPALNFAFDCSLPNGLHVRPASHLVEVTNAFASDCLLTNLRNHAVANVKSVLAIISADIRYGDRCVVQVSGSDEQSAHQALRDFVHEVLPGCDVPFASDGRVPQPRTLPRVLQARGVGCHFGLPVSQGFGMGKAVIVNSIMLPQGLSSRTAADPEQELERFTRALGIVRRRIRQKVAQVTSSVAENILLADLAIANDVSLTETVREAVGRGTSAEQAIIDAGQFFVSHLRQSESEYIRERASDVQEICLQLLAEIRGGDLELPAIELREPSVVIAESLAPQQLLAMNGDHLKAIVFEHSVTTSHALVLARSQAIPAVVGVKNARFLFSPRQEVVVDANRGFIVPNHDHRIRDFYASEVRTLERRREFVVRHATGRATTRDGKTLDVAANASSAHELAQAFANGADGVGLFRTEVLFLGKQKPPSEEEQFAIYAEATRAAAGRPVHIRTFDMGADKPAPYLNLAEEDNPFLGYRGARLYAGHKDLLLSQLRAILRASAFGRIQILVPMIVSVEEVVYFNSVLSEAKQSLLADGISFDAGIRVGIMIEVPAVALILDQLCATSDFFSIGTNDLSQYFFAADRNNPKVAGLSNVRYPAFLRFLKQIVDQVHRGGKPIGMCGEMAADVRHLPLLLGLGLDEISLPSSQIPEVKRRLSQLSATECTMTLHRAIDRLHIAEVDAIVDSEQPAEEVQPLLSEDLVLLGSMSQSKEEAIQEMVNALYVAGRTEDRDRMEESLWAREAVYPTGLGHGFATPHCKTEAVTDDSISILRLTHPIDWGSVDDQPVSMVILIALRYPSSAGRHMQVFSILGRKLMNDDFRENLLAIDSPHDVVTYLTEQLGLSSGSTRHGTDSEMVVE